jgi:hypothetical protein
LIIAVDNNPVEDLDTFRRLVDQSKAGEKIAVSVFRDGEIVELPVTVGKETYQKWGYFTLGFRLGTELDLIPTPDFNILHLISYQTNDTRLQLHSPEYKYYRDALMLSADQTDRNPESYTDNEGWDAWFVIFGLPGKKNYPEPGNLSPKTVRSGFQFEQTCVLAGLQEKNEIDNSPRQY